jgi:hypothetical protein
VTITPTTGFRFATAPGGATTASIAIKNGTSVAQTLRYDDSVPWLIAASALSKTLQPGESFTVTLTGNFAGMAAGTYTGQGYVSGGPSPVPVPIQAVLTVPNSPSAPPPPPTNLRLGAVR